MAALTKVSSPVLTASRTARKRSASDMRASAEYRMQVAQNLLQRFWLETRRDWPLLVRSIALKWLDEGADGRATAAKKSPAIPVAVSHSPAIGFRNRARLAIFLEP